MKKTYLILILLLCLLLLSTFNQKNYSDSKNKKNYFFKVKYIQITNENLIAEEEIKNKLSYVIGKNIFNLKEKKIRNSVLGINFLKEIEVKKKYPNTILIKITETVPLAILIRKEKKYLLDNSSVLIPFDKRISSDNLPNVFGKNAEIYFISFLQKLKDVSLKRKFKRNRHKFL